MDKMKKVMHGVVIAGLMALVLINPSVNIIISVEAREGLGFPRMARCTSNEGTSSSSSFSSVDYKEALEKAILFFEGQRSGKLPSSQRVSWRGDSAVADGRIDNVDLVGGYYDAGDNVKFSWPMSFSVTLLSWAATEFAAEVEASGQLGHLREAIRWGSDFILKSHTSPTALYTQIGDGSADHDCWMRPEDMDTPRTLIKVTAASPGTEPAADAAAALASASVVFRGTDRAYSARLLASSKTLFDFANNYRGSYSGSCPFYCSYSGYQDELLWAASWMFKATKEDKYLAFASSNAGWSQQVPEFSWDNKFAGAQMLLAKEHMQGQNKKAGSLEKYKNDADSFVCSLMPGSGNTRIQTTPGGLLFTRDTANLQYASSAAFLLLFYSKTLRSAGALAVNCNSRSYSTSQIADFARSQVDYILGKNPLNYSYMAGFGGSGGGYPKRVHHRGASIPSVKVLPGKVGCKEGFSSWFSTGDPNPNTHVGAVVGGPGSDDRFADVRSDSGHLEPATYINAAFVCASAALLSGGKLGDELLLPQSGDGGDGGGVEAY